MTGFEYKVVPAPMRGLKARGVKGTPARFANALQTVMNDLGAQGWEYQRTDTLPVEERQDLTGKTTTFQNMLVFRRTIDLTVDDTADVAALIEDQTEILTEAEAAPEPEIEDVIPAEEETVTAQGLVGDMVPEKADAQPAQDRVSATLKAPFAFPWNNRATAKDTGDKEPTFPAE